MSVSLVMKGRPLAAPKAYAQDLGWRTEWTAQGTIYIGYYRAPGLRYEGWVDDNRGKLQFYIRKPPINLLHDTDFGGCFHPRNNDWWLITFKPYDLPADLSSGVAAIQKALRRAFEVRAARRRSRA